VQVGKVVYARSNTRTPEAGEYTNKHMTRRTIAIVASGFAIAVGAIALALMTRADDEPLKRSTGASEATAARTTASTEAPPVLEHSTAIASGADRAVVARDPTEPDVAGLGTGSAGDQLDKLADEFAQHHWANAMAQCLSPTVAMAGAKQCTIAACELHDFMHSTKFYAHVAADDRAEVTQTCEQAHVLLDRPRWPGRPPHPRPLARSPATGSNG
jgi:hypothetical protein